MGDSSLPGLAAFPQWHSLQEYGLPPTAVREIKSMREVHGPHIVELVDCFAHKSNLFLVLEYMENESLEELIRDRSVHLTEGDVKAYMWMVLQALAEVHRHSFVHR